ncbi:hypothetical protein [Microcoleus sp. FACHB-672]|uniref:hypothetical protein n=1 Tax=Microcoleus sp. FACHB-672 TaxID=2692825 RepID=UPI00168387DC|nr:hypothetical protein [Microcoleus sp. FACHB-672]MBD2041527.1 hypothetical protein [Microcoleus sp. FACHB-672]
MLLVLDSSLIAEIDPSSNVIHALDLIAHSRRLGKHIVFGQREVMKFLATWELLSVTSRAVYRKLYEDLPTSLAYLNEISLSVEIVLEDVLEILDRGNSRVIRVSVNYFTDFSILDKTVILSENHDDVLFYKRLARVYLTWKNIGNLDIAYEPRSGGGGTTDREFDSLQKSKQKFCLCILDSDKKTPKLNVGNTAKAVLKINQQNQPLCDALVLSVREIENLIPTAIYRETFINDVNKQKAILFLESLDNSSLANARNYLDMKEGIKLGKILEEEPQTEFRKYWLTFAKKFSSHLSTECLSNEKCSQESSKKCQCFVTLGFGDNIMKKIEKVYLDKDISHMISEELKPEWERIGAIITAWCCASSQISTVSTS